MSRSCLGFREGSLRKGENPKVLKIYKINNKGL
jgi:hypothetical protein